MSRTTSTSKLQNTLGFFLHGIPTVFIRSDIIFLANPFMQKYLEFNRNVLSGAENGGAFIHTDEIMSGYELAITPLHEVRHFHDALLSFSLFELFALKVKENYCIMQIPQYIHNLKPQDLPIGIKDFQSRVNIPGRFLLNDIINSRTRFSSLSRQLFGTHIFSGQKISISYLLEANAIATEIVSVIMDYGHTAAIHYYENVVLRLPLEYRFLLECFVEKYKAFEDAIISLHHLASYCLYFFDNPVAEFVDKYQKCQTNGDARITQDDIISLSKTREQSLEKRIDEMTFVGPDGCKIEIARGDELTDSVFHSLPLIYDCRKTLINKYIGDYCFNITAYLERLDEMPVPPLIFYPPSADFDREVECIYESDFKTSNRPYYIIAGFRDNDNNMRIAAGLTTLLGTMNSALSFSLVDLMLAAQYFCHSLFEGGGGLYHPLIDHIYDKIFRKHFLTRTPED